jgi:hypothetical protein
MAGYQPAFMKAPSAPQIQTFTFNDGKNTNGNNGGMNTRLQADQIRIDQSPDMLNMNYREGVPSNRFGFNRIAETSYGIGAIRGLIEHRPIIGTSEMLMVHGGKILIL